MAKDDFLIGALQGLYNSGVGNPEVQERRRNQALQEAYYQRAMDNDAASQGLVRAPAHEATKSISQSIIGTLFPGSQSIADAYPRYVPDPNAQVGYIDKSGNLSFTPSEGSIRLSPQETKDFAVKKATQAQYVIPQLDASGNVVGTTPLPQGTRSAGFAKPAPVSTKGSGTAKPGSSVEATFKLYETARDGLTAALNKTATGPVVGRFPAFTANQQSAQGAVAAMAPVLKQLFRVAGEGVFTDRDQALLLDMIPTRTVEPAAAKEIVNNIDNIVKVKLGMSTETTSTNTGAKIRVRNKKTGQTGSISEQFYDPNKYERL